VTSRRASPLLLAVIRLLHPKDGPEWFRMRHALWPDCTEAMHRCEMAEMSSTDSAVFVHERPTGSLGGFVELSVRDRVDGSLSPRVGYVEGWYVDPDLRGQGIGRALIAQAETWAKGLGFTEIASDAEINNTGSIRAHAALGFRETFHLVHFLKSL